MRDTREELYRRAIINTSTSYNIIGVVVQRLYHVQQPPRGTHASKGCVIQIPPANHVFSVVTLIAVSPSKIIWIVQIVVKVECAVPERSRS